MNSNIYWIVGAALLLCILGGLILPVLHVPTPAFVDGVITLTVGALLAMMNPHKDDKSAGAPTTAPTAAPAATPSKTTP